MEPVCSGQQWFFPSVRSGSGIWLPYGFGVRGGIGGW